MITLEEPRAAERSGSAAPLAASGRPSSPSIVLLDNYDSFTFNLTTVLASKAQRCVCCATTLRRLMRSWRSAATRS